MSLLVQALALLRNNKGQCPSIYKGGDSQATSNIHPPCCTLSLSSIKLSFLQNLSLNTSLQPQFRYCFIIW